MSQTVVGIFNNSNEAKMQLTAFNDGFDERNVDYAVDQNRKLTPEMKFVMTTKAA
jgi:hypothetical protein